MGFLRTKLSRAVRGGPQLSVIVPVFNSEPYLVECLDSLLDQSPTDLEIIAVDDGSTDASGEVLARYEAENPGRVRVVTQANAGLGGARNTGIGHARGRYLTFVDSDDTVPPGTFALMVATLERTGSDFVGGALDRTGSGARPIGGTLREVHAKDRLAATLEDFPIAIYDIFCCTKVFRTDFWHRAGLGFPVGTRYEDQVPCLTAYLAARSFDVLSAVTYHWRLRDEGGSITQTKAEIDNLRDRADVSRAVLSLLADRPVLRTTWLSRRVIGNDLGLYARYLPEADDAYWAELHRWAADVLTASDWDGGFDVAPAKQQLARALADGDRAAAVALVLARRSAKA